MAGRSVVRLLRKWDQAEDSGPLVLDRQGVPIGVHVPVAPSVDESRHARRLRRLESLRRTRELDGQYRLRCEVSLFCSDPPR
jgi:hypothetical protein